MDEKEDPPRKSAWTHDAKVGFGPVKEAVRDARDKVASSITELQREIEKKRAVLAGLGRR